MGGALISKIFGLPAKRIPKEEYDALTEEVLTKLRAARPHARCEVTRSFHSKCSWGDADFVVEVFPNDCLNEQLEELFSVKPHVNGSVVSLPVRGFQCDFIKTGRENFDIGLAFYNNEAGCLCGRVAYKQGLKFGHDGLHLKLMLGGFEQYFVFEKDPRKCYELLGFDYDVLLEGFYTPQDMYRWVIAGKYFSPEIFAFENLTHANRMRNAKRPVYANFVKFLKTQNLPSVIFDKDKTSEAILARYPELHARIAEREKSIAESVERRAKFNGDIVKSITGLEGKSLGDFIKHFKQNADAINASWLDEFSAEQIRQEISICFLTWKVQHVTV